ncbi:uncharacterized protein BDR25DRAFT_361908 [Lindgomyces ingoldianus]|uniref:Uncharacterized protein n=1 Tax=Lindgomyces ingoldianus TaxID=673940 RepID=A0ACB6QB25_9PLEO|nr:uncharacterized protein BDR25DRAFT_361908 [Lindgomyces ingoldianus]KAF2464164.1 hypothetical protein BDR25DRAFT_361908 [Lindgomyces ingoldianus]
MCCVCQKVNLPASTAEGYISNCGTKEWSRESRDAKIFAFSYRQPGKLKTTDKVYQNIMVVIDWGRNNDTLLVKHHGLPEAIASGQGAVHIKVMATDMRKTTLPQSSTAFHPKTNEQLKYSNQIPKQYFQSYVSFHRNHAPLLGTESSALYLTPLGRHTQMGNEPTNSLYICSRPVSSCPQT